MGAEMPVALGAQPSLGWILDVSYALLVRQTTPIG